MTDDTLRPVLFLKAGCPHCLKVRLFLLEAGLADRVEQRQFTPGDEAEAGIREALTGRVAKVSFPAIRFAGDEYVTESDVIIGRLAEMFGVSPETLPVFSTYAGTVLPRYTAARREAAELKKRLGEAA